MNRPYSRKEVSRQTEQPHTARRAVRYRAAERAQQVIAQQFPDMFADTAVPQRPVVDNQEVIGNARQAA
jgi:hypothetical protein